MKYDGIGNDRRESLLGAPSEAGEEMADPVS